MVDGHLKKRVGMGRPQGSRTKAQLAAIDVAKLVLMELDQVALWKKFILGDDEKLAADCLRYLTDRVHGKPMQQTVISGSIGLADVLAKANEMAGDE